MKPSDSNREKLLDSWLALMGDGPAVDHLLQLPVLSGSMAPGIPLNSIVHVESTRMKHCRCGQVMVYRDGDRLVVHRVLLRLGFGSSAFIYEKGDVNDRGSWIRANNIRGLVRAIEFQDGDGPKPVVRNIGCAWSSLIRDLKHRILSVPRRIIRGRH